MWESGAWVFKTRLYKMLDSADTVEACSIVKRCPLVFVFFLHLRFCLEQQFYAFDVAVVSGVVKRRYVTRLDRAFLARTGS